MTSHEPNEKPLQSWKEIAAYLERDVRTAHRWEKEAGLPVRRHTDRKQASVYAYPSELDAWRAGRPTQAFDEPQVAAWKRPRTWAAAAALAAAAVALFYGPVLNPDSRGCRRRRSHRSRMDRRGRRLLEPPFARRQVSHLCGLEHGRTLDA